jgi:hypothetical protein
MSLLMEQTSLDWPHPEKCPSDMCRGQFFWIKHYGMVCSVRLYQLTGGSMVKVCELSDRARIERMEGLGLA